MEQTGYIPSLHSVIFYFICLYGVLRPLSTVFQIYSCGWCTFLWLPVVSRTSTTTTYCDFDLEDRSLKVALSALWLVTRFLKIFSIFSHFVAMATRVLDGIYYKRFFKRFPSMILCKIVCTWAEPK